MLRCRRGGVPGGVGKADKGVLRPFVEKPPAETLYAHADTIRSLRAGYVGGCEW